MSGPPTVQHAHVERIQLLRKLPAWRRLNDAPFRVLHAVAFALFAYCWFTHVPEAVEPADEVLDGTVTAQPMALEQPQNSALALDPELDGTVEQAATVAGANATDGAAAGALPPPWEPKTPAEFVQVAWVIIAVAHALANLFCIWVVRVKVFCQYRRVSELHGADSVLCVAKQNHGSTGIALLTFRTIDVADASSPGGLRKVPHTEFDFRRIRFELDPETNTFSPLRFPDSGAVRDYLTARGLGSEAEAVAALEKWGANTAEVPVPKFMDLLKEQMVAPFFIFQVFCVCLWVMDMYMLYSLFTLGMLVVFECTVAFQRIRTLTDLRAIQVPKQHVQVLRSGEWQSIPGEMLLPGDVFSVVHPHSTAAQKNEGDAVVPCDALLISGSCIADEAVLTGESTPQWKEPVAGGNPDAPDATRSLDVQQDKLHVLFGGTKVIDASAGPLVDTPDGGAAAVVLRTGFETAQGRLMRTILFSTERLSANTAESGLFIAFLLVFAIAAAGYILHHGLQEPPEKRSRFKLYLSCTMVITSVIPPDLPMQLTMAVNNSLLALRKKGIFCTEPFRIPYAGKIEVCCFDKTGTLTSDNMVLRGVSAAPGMAQAAPTPDRPAPEPVADAALWPHEATLVLAGAQSLMNVDAELVGDPLEKAAFLATEWLLKGTKDAQQFEGRLAGTPAYVTHVYKHHFSSDLKRMSVVAKVTHSRYSGTYVLTKGAPEVLKPLLADCPKDFDAAYRRHAAQGSRVIALAAKRLGGGISEAELKRMPRSEAESGLSYAGLAVFEAPLKEGSEPALKALADSSHQLVMITGDTALTACHVAAQVHIVDRPVAILSCDQAGAVSGANGVDPSDDHFAWLDPEGQTVAPFSREPADVVNLALSYDMCVTGDALEHCERASVDAVVIACTQVFARVSPDQKEHIIKVHRTAGRTTMMCGDGTNDVGALNAAHVGIALMEPPSKQTVAAARAAQKQQLIKKQNELRDRLNGIPPPPKRTTDAAGNLLPGAKMLKQFEDAGRPIPPAMRKMAAWMDEQNSGEMDGSIPVLKPGDASMAAPFTIRAHDVGPATDIIKQGRCTLVITVQMFKILGLTCLATAFSLSVLSLDGVKLGDKQATFAGVLQAGLFFCVSNAKPRDALARARPHQSVFSRYAMGSLLGQMALQIGLVAHMWLRAKQLMPKADAQSPEMEVEFQPNLVNTVCWLVQTAVGLLTFAVNYVGHPHQTPLAQNKGMIGSLRFSALGWLALATGFVPQLSDWAQLVSLPAALRVEMMVGLVGVVVGSVALERWLRGAFPAFAPPRKGYMALLHLLPDGHRAKKDL